MKGLILNYLDLNSTANWYLTENEKILTYTVWKKKIIMHFCTFCTFCTVWISPVNVTKSAIYMQYMHTYMHIYICMYIVSESSN